LELPDDPQQRDAIAQADPARLRQVLLDLIENADKYSPEGRPILLKLQHDGNNAAIEVIDQGIGIPRRRTGCRVRTLSAGQQCTGENRFRSGTVTGEAAGGGHGRQH
jgi:light-regulated signal transduction histidine kinase (bacteriophytochrome)